MCGGSSRIVFSPLGYALIVISTVSASVCGSGRQLFVTREEPDRTKRFQFRLLNEHNTQTLVTVDGSRPGTPFTGFGTSLCSYAAARSVALHLFSIWHRRSIITDAPSFLQEKQNKLHNVKNT